MISGRLAALTELKLKVFKSKSKRAESRAMIEHGLDSAQALIYIIYQWYPQVLRLILLYKEGIDARDTYTLQNLPVFLE